MTKKPDISKLYNYHNEEGVLLEMSSDYKLISRELKSINVAFENRTIDDILQELEEIRNLYFIFFYNDYDDEAEFEVITDALEEDYDYIKINFLIEYLKDLKLYE
ncbi:hypothetical protein SL053_000224 [Flavobacterium psychrophilum]|uniref:Uncharacterized protein n=3 Tax=Flavobacterium psychrophilum TaxID=96345 RepID=A6H2B5_FLAPJ|nr:hypothetical protein [Flavobacterium psychrophilum]AIG31159.1 hypothetical protein IA03_12085 [Flavobacterium psychrophilum]AIG33436.1 hypothetical protein IA01_12115 [Flavobacterium psychrophilum]AIG35586.1 hypothetical protein IA02_11490 [Flavobacterium psychrophilum]AIG37947.1 hypothetical protein IA04_11970 [Flavobacterium psychrophilum]AIG40218.1 hypothetical protein IA05_12090 [Flavobacterium psychrophilum]